MCALRLVLETRREGAGGGKRSSAMLIVRETYGVCTHCFPLFSAFLSSGWRFGVYYRWVVLISLLSIGEWSWGGPRRQRRTSLLKVASAFYFGIVFFPSLLLFGSDASNEEAEMIGSIIYGCADGPLIAFQRCRWSRRVHRGP